MEISHNNQIAVLGNVSALTLGGDNGNMYEGPTTRKLMWVA